MSKESEDPALVPSTKTAESSHRQKNSGHVLETQRLSRFLDVKVERSYQELDDVLEEEKKKEFLETESGKARSRLYNQSFQGIGHLTAVERANHLLRQIELTSKAHGEGEGKIQLTNRRAVFSPRHIKAKNIMSVSPMATKSDIESFQESLVSDPSCVGSSQQSSTKSPKQNGQNIQSDSGTSKVNRREEDLLTRSKSSKIKSPPLAIRNELANNNLIISAELKLAASHAATVDDKPEDDDDDGDNLKDKILIKDIDMSMMFVRPPLRGIGLDGGALRGDSIQVRRLKRFLRERGLNDAGSDTQVLKLRLTHADLLDEIQYFQKLRGNSRNITKALNNSLSKNTQMMRRLAKMNNAEMWRNLGNDKIKRFVETFTLVHSDPPDGPSKFLNKRKFILRDSKDVEEENQLKASRVAEYARHQHKISQVRYRACALCEHRFDIRNLTKAVTLKSVWNKRQQFPTPVVMPENLEGRWDKLYGVVRVCALCSQFFEPDILKGNEDEEAEREAEAEMLGVETRKRWRSWSLDATKLREQRSKSLLQRNRSLFKRPCGFGGSSIRSSLFENRKTECNDGASSFVAAAITTKTPTINTAVTVIVPNITTPRRPGTAGAASSRGQYLKRGDGALINSKQNPRPSSAGPRVVKRAPGFGGTSSRIITYRGHNELNSKMNEYRAKRIDPLKQARDMLMQSTKSIQNGVASITPKRPASAGSSNRRKTKNLAISRRPMSAAPRSRRSETGTMSLGGRKRFRQRRGRSKKKNPTRPKSEKSTKKRPKWVGIGRCGS
jgi:hypothetical protein